MKLQYGKHLAGFVWYIQNQVPRRSFMASTGRASSLTAGRRRPSESSRRPVPALRDVSAIAKPGGKPGAVGPASHDLAGRLRALQGTLRSRVEHKDALVDIVRSVNPSLQPQEIGSLVIARASRWIPATGWAVVSSGQGGQTGKPSVVSAQGVHPDFRPSALAIATWVMEHDAEFVSANLRDDRRIPGQAVAASVVAFPLACRGRSVGALVGLDRSPSSRAPRLPVPLSRGIRLLLEPVAVALDNALLLKRAEALSVTDDLTSLYNSRYLAQVLGRETKRAMRIGHPLSLLFLDLDGFKSVNDTHGHLAGSRALVEAAAVIRSSARETDVVARFGGDEFSLVLPDTGNEGALAVGERVRQRIAAHPFLASEGLDIRLTVSIGVATLPDCASSAEELMRAADVAMYRVKERGKNGIQAATIPADK
jgi:diguanylate cyclase (GGDEF)-like protein